VAQLKKLFLSVLLLVSSFCSQLTGMNRFLQFSKQILPVTSVGAFIGFDISQHQNSAFDGMKEKRFKMLIDEESGFILTNPAKESLVTTYLSHYAQEKKVDPNKIIFSENTGYRSGSMYAIPSSSMKNFMGLTLTSKDIQKIDYMLQSLIASYCSKKGLSYQELSEKEKITILKDYCSTLPFTELNRSLIHTSLLYLSNDYPDIKEWEVIDFMVTLGLIGHEFVHLRSEKDARCFTHQSFLVSTLPITVFSTMLLKKIGKNIPVKHFISFPFLVLISSHLGLLFTAKIYNKLETKLEEKTADLHSSDDPAILKIQSSFYRFRCNDNEEDQSLESILVRNCPHLREALYFFVSNDLHPHDLTRAEYLEKRAQELERQQKEREEID
jgi:hypothetical protein